MCLKNDLPGPAPMRAPLLLGLLLLGGGLRAQQIAVFGEKDFYVLDAGSAPSGPREPDRAAFVKAYKADLARHAPYEEAMDLVSPPAWGKTVGPSTRGRIQFRTSFPGGFVCRLSLENLLADHDYILTLNGNPSKAGNGLLLSAIPPDGKERYYDFLIVRTDAHGGYSADLGIFLKPSAYDVRCYVKDTSDFKIVLYRDFFKFQVR
jgi:hypothetical protein